MRSRFLLKCLVLVALLISGDLHAATKEVGIFDFDGTLTREKKSEKGAFVTHLVLFRAEGRSSPLIPIASGPREVLISSQEYETRAKKYLSHGDGGRVSISTTLTTMVNGQKQSIQPGAYFLDPERSFRYYMESEERERNYLLEDAKGAFESGGNWQGSMLPIFQKWIEKKYSSAENRRNTIVVIPTMRGHSRAEWAELFQFWIDVGVLPKNADAIELSESVYALGRSEFDEYGPRNNSAERKAGFMKELLRNLKQSEPDVGPHLILFADDSQPNVKAIKALFMRRATEEYMPAKYVLINAGTVSQLREHLPSLRMMTFSTEFFRWTSVPDSLKASMSLDLFNAPIQSYRSEASSCRDLLRGGL